MLKRKVKTNCLINFLTRVLILSFMYYEFLTGYPYIYITMHSHVRKVIRLWVIDNPVFFPLFYYLNTFYAHFTLIVI
jgi:hypothetical protein